jgi:hypothetical protein
MSSKIELRYRDGYSEGVRRAEEMIEQHLPTGGEEIELREEAHAAVDTAHTDAGRLVAAWRLGMVRGFRDVVRS